jgi:hypothetical protein
MSKLNELSEQVLKIDRKLSALDSRVSEGLQLKEETNFIKVIIIFIY